MPISCSVVSYHNTAGQIAEVLRSVRATPLDVPIYLVDNSHDNALEAVARRYGAIYRHHPDNLGYGVAHNIAMRDGLAHGSDYHLVLNPDVSFGPEVIPTLHAYMETHRDIGLIMPDIRYPDGSRQHLCKLLPNPLDLSVRRFLPRLYALSGRLDNYEMRRGGYDGITGVPALSGCFMFLRGEVIRKVGGFDERFFMYLEDVDLSRRIGRIARTVYFPGVSIIHDYQKGSYKNSTLLRRHIRSAIQYFNKWGWIFDAERREVNRVALEALRRRASRPAHSPEVAGAPANRKPW